MSVAAIATVAGARPVVELGVGNTNTPTGQATWDTARWYGELPPTPTGTDVLLESFDNLSAWTLNGTPTITAGRTGTCVQIGGGGVYAQYSIAAGVQDTTITVGFAYRRTDANATLRDIFRLYTAAGTHQNTLQVNPATDTLMFCRGPSTVIGTSAAGVVAVNVWAYIEVQVFLHDTAGSVTVRVDDTPVIAVTGVDTQAAGTAGIPYTTFRLYTLITAGPVHQYDDLYITNDAGAAFKGDFTIPPGPPPPPSTELPDDRWASLEPTWLDITCDVHDIEIDQGRDRSISRWQVGTASLTVDNRDGRYDVNAPVHDPAALSVRPGRQVRVGVWIDDQFHLLGRWFIDATVPTYDPVLEDVVELSCVDAKGQAGKVEVAEVADPGVGGSEWVSARIGRILDAVGWPATSRDVATSAVTLLATNLGAAAVDLLDVAADSAGGAVFADDQGRVVFRARDWQTFEPATPVDGTIGNVPAVGDDIVDGPADVVFLGRQLEWMATTGGAVCPSGWEMSFESADMATRVLAGRQGEPPGVYNDVANQVLYGIETFTRTDLECASPADIDLIGERLLRVLSADFMPNIAAVTIDAGTGAAARDLCATVDPTAPTRYRGFLERDDRVVFDRQFMTVGVAHRIDPETWTCRIALDDAGPFAAVGDRWDEAGWDSGMWADPVATLLPVELEAAGNG